MFRAAEQVSGLVVGRLAGVLVARGLARAGARAVAVGRQRGS